MQLYDYQSLLDADIQTAWDSGAQNVMAQLPTGGGKSVILGNRMSKESGVCFAIAHRAELVQQLSLALARYQIPHDIIAQTPTIKGIISTHIEDVGVNYVRRNSNIYVASVDTLINRRLPIYDAVSMWAIDEGHHVLKENKWGKAVGMFPETARGLLLTATPCRADRKGLGRSTHGIVDKLILGPTQRELINRGFLSDYVIVCAESDLKMSDADITSSGDYSPNKLKTAAKKSHIVGDVVDEYLKRANGKLGITFATDVETAEQIAAKFKSSGVPAEIISSKTPLAIRRDILKRFRNRQILQLVNVDMFGEGFDLPAIEVVSMARPTASLALYMQQFGRGLRILEGKEYALIIDHVGNVLRHGPPDKADRHLSWTLDAGTSRGLNPEEELKICDNPTGGPDGLPCIRTYAIYLSRCPYCGYGPKKRKPEAGEGRGTPQQVEGDLIELDPVQLAKLRGDILDFDTRTVEEERERLRQSRMPRIGIMRNVKLFAENKDAQESLRSIMAQWGGYQTAMGLDDREIQRKFYLLFGVDVLSAQLLGTKEANALNGKITEDIIKCSINGQNVGTSRKLQY